MGIKKSLGYSPLGGPRSDESEFDFVADRKPAGAENVTSIFKEAERSNGLKLASSFAEKVKTQAEHKQEEDRPEKKVASYYLEKETIVRLKKCADNSGVSYSSIVEHAIKKHLDSISE